jgi:hypothetical protein
MSYTPQEWNDDDPATPLTAARVDHMESGIEDADLRITALEANQGVYPLAGYGFHSASCLPESVTTPSTIAGWHLRVWVPPNQEITKVGMPVTTAGTLGAGGLNGFAIYSDDGSVKLGETDNDDTLWSVFGMRTATVATPIAALTTGRFVRVLVNVEGYADAPWVGYALTVGDIGLTLNGPAAGSRRSAFTSSLSSWPSTIAPDSLGTASNYLPFVVLG